jgi:hypothetical protein
VLTVSATDEGAAAGAEASPEPGAGPAAWVAPGREYDRALFFESSGPTYRLMQRIGVIQGEGPSIGRRLFWFFLVTWVPLLVLSLVGGRALGPTPRESFLLDFASYARFFAAVPLLIIAEVVVGPRLRDAGLRFVGGAFVRPADLPAFDAAVGRVVRRRESALAEALILGLALYGAWNLSADNWQPQSAPGWHHATLRHGVASGYGIAAALPGLWYHCVSLPIMQFLLVRWVWRLAIWSLFLWDVSRLDLDVVPTHPDQAGGLGFLGQAHMTLAIFAVAASVVLSAEVAFRVRYESAALASYKLPLVIYLIVVEAVVLGPLLVFAPLLVRARRVGLGKYGALANRYNRAFHRKWVEGPAPDEPPHGEPLLGSADIQSLADLGNSFGFVRAMNVLPVTRQHVVRLALLTVIPMAPLVFLVMPVGAILDYLTKMLI